MDGVFLLVGLAAGLSLTMAAAWLVCGWTGRSGWADAVWSFGVGAAGIVAALAPVTGMPTPRAWIVAALVAIWSVRLGSHIAARTIGAGEDPRYVLMRSDWGADFRRRFFWFLQIEALAACPLVLSVFVAAHNPAPDLRAGDILGMIVLATAIAGEAIADRQLRRFRADPANRSRVCDVGLWGLSRHPNYFFEWLAWLAYAAIAVEPAGTYSWGWLSLSAPLLMYWLLVHVSGIPPLEAHMRRSRGQDFADYQARVSAFWPIPAARRSR
jgi:steroid 5-alpha reductase family enzyme